MVIRRVMIVLTAAALLLSMGICAAASSAPDRSFDGKSSITIQIKLPEDLENRGSLSLYRVGDIRENDGNYSFAPAGIFAEKWQSYDDLFSLELARELADFAEDNNLTCMTEKVDENGAAAFGQLEFGLYLVVQHQSAKGYASIQPFLIGVPNLKDGSYVYQVNASPKIQLETAPTEPSKPTEPTEPLPPQLPQTGQMNWPVPVLAVSGLLLILIGAILCSGKRKGRHEA